MSCTSIFTNTIKRTLKSLMQQLRKLLPSTAHVPPSSLPPKKLCIMMFCSSPLPLPMLLPGELFLKAGSLRWCHSNDAADLCICCCYTRQLRNRKGTAVIKRERVVAGRNRTFDIYCAKLFCSVGGAIRAFESSKRTQVKISRCPPRARE